MTEREKVLLKREGASKALWLRGNHSIDSAERDAAEMFPLPKTTRRRVVNLGRGWEYRVSEDGLALESRGYGEPWTVAHTLSSLATLLELTSNPDEEVDDV